VTALLPKFKHHVFGRVAVVFDVWVAQFDDVEIPCDAAGVSAALASLNRLQAKLAVAVGTFDVRQEWELDGSTSLIAWLKGRGLTAGDASQLAMWGKRSRALPILADAWTAGRLSTGQVKAVLANVRDRHVGLFAAHEAELVPSLEYLDVGDTQTAMTQWRLKAEALDDHPSSAEPPDQAHMSQTLDGRWYLNGSFAAEPGAVVDIAMRVAASTSDWNRIPAERRADALVDICRWFLDNQDIHTGRRHRPHLNVVVDGDSLTGEGHLTGRLAEQRIPLDSPTLSRLLCDCSLHRVLRDSTGAIIDYGRATRTIPAPLFNALVIRDRHCRFGSCDRPPAWTEGHHVQWYSHGGPTNLENLVLLCSRHHHLLHKPGWHAKLEPDGALVVRRPGGYTATTYPPDNRQRQPAAS